MENQLLLSDSLNSIRQTIEIVAPVQINSLLDTFCKIATILIAIINLVLVIYIFKHNKNRDIKSKEESRKLNLLKTLVLDYSMSYFYEFYRNIDNETRRLKDKNLCDNDKKILNENLLEYGKTLENKFIDLFLGINQNLYKQIKNKMDDLLDGFTENIFNENINIYTDNNFCNLITGKITESKTQIIQILFNYSGKDF